MPQPRKYETAADRQRAYRARRAAEAPTRVQGAPGYAKWRKSVREAYALLEAAYEEMSAWMQDRSERWQESERASEVEADRDKLYEVLEGLDDLAVLKREIA